MSYSVIWGKHFQDESNLLPPKGKGKVDEGEPGEKIVLGPLRILRIRFDVEMPHTVASDIFQPPATPPGRFPHLP